MNLEISLGNLITIGFIVFSAGLSYARMLDKIEEEKKDRAGLKLYIEEKLTDITNNFKERFKMIEKRQERYENQFTAFLKHYKEANDGWST